MLTLSWRAMQLHITRVFILSTIYTASEPGTGEMVHGVVHGTGEMVVGGPGVAWQPLNLMPHCLAQGHQKPHRHPKSENLGR